MIRLDGCWGDDEPGRAFGANYGPKGDSMLQHLAGLVTALHGVPGGLHAMARRYQDAESSSHLSGPG